MDVVMASKSSILRVEFPNHSLVDVSRLVIPTEDRCKHIEQFIDITCTMAMNDGNRVNLSVASAPHYGVFQLGLVF